LQSLAQPIGDQGSAVLTRRDPPLLARTAIERRTANRCAVAHSHGLERRFGDGVANEPESGFGCANVPQLVIAMARRKLQHRGAVVAIYTDHLSRFDVGNLIPAGAVKASLRTCFGPRHDHHQHQRQGDNPDGVTHCRDR